MTTNMRILGIDPGTHCGWALREPSGGMTSGVWELKHGRHDSGGMKMIRLNGYLNEIYNISPFGMIAYEEVRRHMGTDAAHIYGAIYHKIQEWTLGIRASVTGEVLVNHTGIPVGTIKKFATGKGNANKDAMVLFAHAKWPNVHGYAEDWPHDEADARWIAECAWSQLNGDKT